jgi:hypothetical protein
MREHYHYLSLMAAMIVDERRVKKAKAAKNLSRHRFSLTKEARKGRKTFIFTHKLIKNKNTLSQE